jgi:hypothetical protein
VISGTDYSTNRTTYPIQLYHLEAPQNRISQLEWTNVSCRGQFYGQPSATGWRVETALDLSSFDNDKTADTQFTEILPGNYRFTTSFPEGHPPQLFLRLAIPTEQPR